MSDLVTFTVGPPEAITDSRLLPAVTADDEAGFVHGADLDEHPDNRPLQVGDLDVAGFATDPVSAADETPPLEPELDGVVAGIDVDDVDEVGFDPADALTPAGAVDPAEGVDPAGAVDPGTAGGLP